MLQQCHTLHLPNLLVILPIFTRYSHKWERVSVKKFRLNNTFRCTYRNKRSTLSYRSLISKICLYMQQKSHIDRTALRNLGIRHLSNCLFVSPAQYPPAVLEMGSAFLTKHWIKDLNLSAKFYEKHTYLNSSLSQGEEIFVPWGGSVRFMSPTPPHVRMYTQWVECQAEFFATFILLFFYFFTFFLLIQVHRAAVAEGKCIPLNI